MMGLFDRRKRDKPERQVGRTEPDELAEQAEPLDEAVISYRTTHLNVLPAGDDVLLQVPEYAAPIVLPAFEFDLLAQCTHFARVEEHAAFAARRTGLPADGVTQRLYDLVDRGLLVSKQDVMARARAAAEVDAAVVPPLDRVAVITSARPASLAACLRSYRERYGAEIKLVVFDDSSEAAVQDENRRVAAHAGAGGQILYVGEAEKRRLVTELSARSGVERDVVGAAMIEFDGCTFHCGANRNAVLLDAAGHAVLMVDDDTTARAASSAEASDMMRLSSRYDPWSLRFFARVEDAREAADWHDVDLLAWHRRFLGRSPAGCVFRSAQREAPLVVDANGVALDLDEADSALIAAFSNGRGRVVATTAGVVGDSGMGMPLSFLSLRGPARDRLLEDYQTNRATRAVHRGADMATVSNTQAFMGAHVAFDLRTTIPPFPPVLRNSDGVFGAVLRMCAPESYIAFLPWLVEHVPPEARAADFDQVVRSVSQVRANDIIRTMAHAYEPGPGVADPAVRLRAFGHYLTALGTMQVADFDELVRSQIVATVGHRIGLLTGALNQENSQPEQWAEDCEAVMTEGLRALTEEEIVVADIPGSAPDERHRRFQRALHSFGRLIEAWPALLEASRDIRVARPL